MTAAIEALLATLLEIASSATTSTVIQSIINGLLNLLPTISNIPLLITGVKNVISALTKNGNTTTEQIAQLQAFDQQCDDAFDTAWAAYQAAYPTTGG